MKKLLLLTFTVILLVSFTSCVHDGPPNEDTPAPDPLNGVFNYGDSTLAFNGDGRSITMHITDDFAAISGLPGGETGCQYVFLLSVGGEYRYDKAEYFRIILGDTEYQFRNALGITDENTVSFYPNDDADASVKFEKR